jgi:hypothetical protein
MMLIVGYRVIGLDLLIPRADWERSDGLYYQLRGYEFEPVWEKAPT